VEKPRKWRYGVNRWFVLLFIILGIVAARYYPPVLPHIQLPAEGLFIIGQNFKWTNTLTAMVLADIIILLIAYGMHKALTSGKMVLDGIWNALEAILELIYNMTDSTAGRWAKSIFPFFATITLFVLIVNWMELIPGVDSIGLLDPHPAANVEIHPTQELFRIGSLPVMTILKGEAEAGKGASIVPFVRVLSTDLNFTVALALIVMFFVQVFGWRSTKGRYFEKFFNVRGIFSRPGFGLIDFGVGILELVSEFSKILSFSFRLFGNIFAGSVLLFVIGSLVPVLAQSGFLALEFFVGLIQAAVFGLLAMIFMSQATQSHQSEGAEH
jgi:F-type H+-transporting ATPase subunit a